MGQGSLTRTDYKKLLDIIHLAYTMDNRQEMWRAVWQELDKLIGFSSAVWLPRDATTRQFVFKDLLPYQLPLKAGLLFTTYYAPLDPLVSSGAMAKYLAAVKITDVIGPSKLVDTEYGHDFQSMISIFYEIAGNLKSQGDLIGCLGIHREKRDGDFTERHRAILDLLLPHLSNALHNLYLREALCQAPDNGVIVLSGEGTVRLMNDVARRALNGHPVQSIPDPDGGAGPSLFQTGAGSYRVRATTVRWGGKDKILILEPLPSQRIIGEKLDGFGLTNREQEIAALVVRGWGNREIAERLFIAEQTVKDHLHDIFAKVKIRRRSELAAKLLKFEPMKASRQKET